MKEIHLAYEYSERGGQALHIHNFNSGHRLFKRYKEIAHLFDQDKDRLVKTARILGVRVINIEHENTKKQHIDLCGKPLSKARELCRFNYG